jgi:gluconokinase
MTSKDTLIAVDIGTTSVKAIVYRIGGTIEGQTSQTYGTSYPQPGFVEQDPDQVVAAVGQVLTLLLKQTNIDPKAVTAIVFSGIWQSMIPIDARGRPLCRSLLWADSRAHRQSNRLLRELGAQRVRARTGCSIHPMYHLPRLLWFKEEAPEIFKRTYKFVSIKEYVLNRFFGEFLIDRSVASGTGIWQMSSLDWDEELLVAIGLSKDFFSPVAETTAVFKKGLRAEFAAQAGLLSGTPGIVGAADGAMAHLGSVGLSDNRMSLTVGTGAALRLRISEPRSSSDTEAWCYYLTEHNWLLGGIIQDAGNVMSWFADNLMPQSESKITVYDMLNTYAQETAPGADGLIFLPFLSGERCPNNRPDARGAVYGLNFSHSRKHLARAVMEGIAYRLYSVYQMLAGPSQPELVITGGLLKSPVWIKITADFFGKRLWLPKVSETSAWGLILIALRSLNVAKNLEDLNRLVEVAGCQEPDWEAHRKYEDIHNTYNDLYRKLFP